MVDGPRLEGPRLIVRSGGQADVDALLRILGDPTVARWWGEPETASDVLRQLGGLDDGQLLVIEAEGQVAGGITFWEETDADYRHAAIDVYLGAPWQGRGLGREAVGLLVRYLIEVRGHHRLTIDPAAANERAIRCYASVGFRPIGIMRRYERGPDGIWHDGLLMDLLREDIDAGG